MKQVYIELRKTAVAKLNERRASEVFKKKSNGEPDVRLLDLENLNYSESEAMDFLGLPETNRDWLKHRRLGSRGQVVKYDDRWEAKVPTFAVGLRRVRYPGPLIADLLINKGEFPEWLREEYRKVTFLVYGGSFRVVVLGIATDMSPAATTLPASR